MRIDLYVRSTARIWLAQKSPAEVETGRERRAADQRQVAPGMRRRSRTGVNIIVGHRLLSKDETLANVGVTAGDVVSVVFKPNRIRCSSTDEIDSRSSEIDPEVLLVVELPIHETRIADRAFNSCAMPAKLIIPDSVRWIETYMPL